MTGFYIIIGSALAALGLFSWLASHYGWFGVNRPADTSAADDSATDAAGNGVSATGTSATGAFGNGASANGASGTGGESGDACCGQHLVCEKDKRLMAQSDIVYFDDEELDAFKDTPAETYDEAALALFSEIFYSIRPEELMEWLNSLRLRGIELPIELRDEALLILAERRNAV